MKYNIIFLSIFFLFIGCKSKGQQDDILNNKTYEHTEFEEIPYKSKVIKKGEKGYLINLIVDEMIFPITLIEENSLSFIKNEKKLSWNQIALNFSYDSSIEDALSQIKILYSKTNKFMFLFPSFGSEETIAYEILVYNDSKFQNLGVYTYDFSNISKITDGGFEINKTFWQKSTFSAKIKLNKVYLQSSNSGNVVDFDKPLETLNYHSIGTLNDDDINKLVGFSKTNEIINAIWRVNCGNTMTLLDISNNNAYISLYSINPTYINTTIKKSSANSYTYLLYFNSIESKEIFYDNKENLLQESISKEKPIAEVQFLDQNNAELNWIGLYNKDSKEYKFKNDNVFVLENSGKNPIRLIRCEE